MSRWTHLPILFWWLFTSFIRVILRFIFCLETILGTIFYLATIFWINSLHKPQNNPHKKVTKIVLVDAFTFSNFFGLFNMQLKPCELLWEFIDPYIKMLWDNILKFWISFNIRTETTGPCDSPVSSPMSDTYPCGWNGRMQLIEGNTFATMATLTKKRASITLKFSLVKTRQPPRHATSPYFDPELCYLASQRLKAKFASGCKSECKSKFASSANSCLDANLNANMRTFGLKNLHPDGPLFFNRVFWHQNRVLRQNQGPQRKARFLSYPKTPSNLLQVKIKAP